VVPQLRWHQPGSAGLSRSTPSSLELITGWFSWLSTLFGATGTEEEKAKAKSKRDELSKKLDKVKSGGAAGIKLSLEVRYQEPTCRANAKALAGVGYQYVLSVSGYAAAAHKGGVDVHVGVGGDFTIALANGFEKCKCPDLDASSETPTTVPRE
jgi:hypothetical protein